MNNLTKRVIILFFILQIIVAQSTLGIPKNQAISDNNMTSHNGNKSNEHQLSIQNLIDNASEHDIIYIPNGTYYEHILINKSITLIGEETTTIDGSYQADVLRIESNNITIRNIDFRNTGGEKENSGIYVEGINITIKDCMFYQSKQGIHLQMTKNVTIDTCLFYRIGRSLCIHESENVFITNCSIAHSALGIYIDQSHAINIVLSTFDTNGVSLYSKNAHHIQIQKSSVKDNSDNHGGLFFKDSASVLITNCSINHNGIGINVDSSVNLTMKNSHITNNTHFAILLRDHAQQITIEHCFINKNLRYGIYCYENTSVVIRNNTIVENLLFGLYSLGAISTLEKNWWGSLFGPTPLPCSTYERISINNYVRHFNKWSTHPYRPISFHFEHPSFDDDILLSQPDLSPYIRGKDSDKDGAPDWWEEKWEYNPTLYHHHTKRDDDADGLTNIEECFMDQWGSNPYKKDIFLEIDWMRTQNVFSSNKPSSHLLQKIKDNFAMFNITLHVDDGSNGEGGEIPNTCANDFASMIDIYWDYFLENNLQNPRKGIFHYAIICDECADVSYPFFGWDHFDSIAISAEQAKRISPQYPRQMIIVGGILHQLGSTLGLLVETHQGNDNWQASKIGSVEWSRYHQYKSSMNYLYKYRLLSYSDGSHGKGDFNDWEHLNFSFFKNSSFVLDT